MPGLVAHLIHWFMLLIIEFYNIDYTRLRGLLLCSVGIVGS